MQHFQLSLLLACTALLSSPVASSFAPSAAHMATRQGKAFVGQQRLFNIRGGTDDEPITPVPPIPSEAVPSIPSSNNKTMAEPQAVQVYIAPVTTTKSLLGPNAVSPGIIRKVLPGFPWHLLPNWLTYIRCLAIPAMVALFYVPGRHVETSILFAVASFTDWLDGYLARRWDITSPFGAFLDPVADKLMVSTALILLSGRFGMHVVIPAAIILAREISVSALREWMAQRGLRDIVKVGFQGKLKTALTMMTLTLYLLVPESDSGTGLLSCVELPAKALLYLCAGITVTSGSVYFRAAAPVLLKAE